MLKVRWDVSLVQMLLNTELEALCEGGKSEGEVDFEVAEGDVGEKEDIVVA